MQREVKQIAIDFDNQKEQLSTEILPEADEREIEHSDYSKTEILTAALTNLQILKKVSKSGVKVISSEHYNIVRTFTVDDMLILEAVWTGTLSVPIGNIRAGEKISAYVEQHYTMNLGEALRRRNYDDFEPFL